MTRARGRTVQFQGSVVLAGLENQGGNLYQVIAEVENQRDPNGSRYLLLPGSRVSMTIHLNGRPGGQGQSDSAFSETGSGAVNR